MWKAGLLTALCVVLVALSALAGCGDAAEGGSRERSEAGDTISGEEEPGSAPHGEGGRIELTPEQVTNARLAYGVVERRAVAGVLEATAQIEPAAERMAKIGSRVAGRVTAIRAAEGDRVRAGQVLAVIESPELGQAKADYLGTLATARVAREIANTEEALFERKISAEREWRQAEAEAVRAEAEKQAAETRLHALGLTDADLEALKREGHYTSTVSVRTPIAGTVAARTASLGQAVEPADALFEVVDLREVWLVIDVYEQSLPDVRVGQEVEVRTAATGERAFTGTVARIGAVVEPQTRTIKVRVVLRNPDAALKPGMFARALLQGTVSQAAEPSPFVPGAAVQRDGEEAIVFVPAGPRSFARRAIKTGQTAEDWVQVLDGLSAGDSVVTTGSFLLKSELRKGELGEGEEH
jgi:cobalt-zinc-cadmium efflux system membrane fusion protein